MLIGNQEIILGDCLKVLKKFDDKIIDVIVTSPPYNLGIKYNSYKDNLKLEKYLSWLKEVFIECKRVLKDSGSIFLNIGGTNTEPWIPYDVAMILRDILILQNDFIWIKSISIKNNSYGHYKPINSNRFVNHMYEKVFHFTKTGDIKINRKSIGVPFQDKINLKAKTVYEDLRCRGNTWFIPYETIQSKTQKGDHPAVFPQQLAEWCIKLSGGSIILDPFVGSGTTLLAADELDCKGIGIEIDEKYFEYAKNQLYKIKDKPLKFNEIITL